MQKTTKPKSATPETIAETNISANGDLFSKARELKHKLDNPSTFKRILHNLKQSLKLIKNKIIQTK